MEVKTISKHILPDTYGEWLEYYKHNVIEPFKNNMIGMINSKERMDQIVKEAEHIYNTISKIKQHYGIDQPKIEHVEVSFSMQI